MTLSRKTPIVRKSRMPRSSRLRPKKRSAAAFARIYGSAERVEWVKSLPCLVCGATPSENAHTVTGGMGRKADAASIVPLCHRHHRTLHDIGVRSFEHEYEPMLWKLVRSAARGASITLGPKQLGWLAQWAACTDAEWEQRSGLTPLSAIVPSVVADLLTKGDA